MFQQVFNISPRISVSVTSNKIVTLLSVSANSVILASPSRDCVTGTQYSNQYLQLYHYQSHCTAIMEDHLFASTSLKYSSSLC